MRRVLFLIPFLLFFHCAFSNAGYDSLLTKLNNTLDRKKAYDAVKLKRIDSLKKLLTAGNLSLDKRYGINLMLYNEYKSFNYHAAYSYSQKLQQIGRLLNDPVKIAYGKIKLGFILLSSGMFKETFDSLKTVMVGLLPDSAKTEYYFLTARTYYDLADFDKDDYYTPIYNKKASQYIDSGLMLCKPNSFEYVYYNGLKYLKNGNTKLAVINLQSLIKKYKLTNHQFAVTASTLSDLYIRQAEPDSAINLLILAAIADVKSATKEAAAMLNLAQLLHTNGDITNAYVFIKQAMDDAIYYGARQRKLQVSAILPIIAVETINSVEKQRLALFFYGAILTILLVIIYKQLQKLKLADKAIMHANHNLQETNHKLNEANTIKDEYIGYYFNLITEYINKLEKFKRSVDNKLITKRYEDIGVLVNNINLTKEREELFINFDKAFLKIFPNFVDRYNALFSDENRVKLLPNQLLNTDLRIFALVRLGINDTEKIAHILEYSVNTIYNYKTRIKSKSIVHNEEFEHAIMAIKAI
ncbi:MAG: Transcriptional regulator [Mucilaginibacter sp.]|nr:Transcriptional regulator [Mucilaginibacter sp.]